MTPDYQELCFNDLATSEKLRESISLSEYAEVMRYEVPARERRLVGLCPA